MFFFLNMKDGMTTQSMTKYVFLQENGYRVEFSEVFSLDARFLTLLVPLYVALRRLLSNKIKYAWRLHNTTKCEEPCTRAVKVIRIHIFIDIRDFSQDQQFNN